jgi:uncharacterized membrane protein YphA (DoxX/SURF4 family)
MTSSQSRRLRIVGLALRLILGVVFVYAAWMKLRAPWHLFAMAVDGYGLLPQWAVIAVARTLPWAELAIGLFLIAGKFPRLFSAGACLLLAGFFALMVRSYLAGAEIECGCFGPGDAISLHTLARDGALLAASAGLAAISMKKKPA